jgi:hypothetical protein
MTNTIVTPQWVTREGLRLLHQKATATERCNKNYQDQFKVAGTKMGTQISVRLPNLFTVRRGAQMQAQNTVERYVTLNLSNQAGVDVNFSSVEMTMQLDDYSERILVPALSVLASTVDSDTLANTNQFATLVGSSSTTVAFATLASARRYLGDALAPQNDGLRTLMADTQTVQDWNVDSKGLFNNQQAIGEAYLDGELAERIQGFNTYETTLLPAYTFGTYSGTPVGKTGLTQGNSGAGNAYVSTSVISTTGWTAGSCTLNAGDVVTFSGVNAVHPETKKSLGYLKQFVVTQTISDSAGEIDMVVSPAVIYGGAYQNVSGPVTSGATVTVAAASGSVVGQNLAMHRDAILFASADLIDLADVVKYTAREEMDGFSMRFAKVYDVNNDLVPGRLDILYGSAIGHQPLGIRVIHKINP